MHPLRQLDRQLVPERALDGRGHRAPPAAGPAARGDRQADRADAGLAQAQPDLGQGQLRGV